MTQTVIGIFHSTAEASQAIERLHTGGFASTDIELYEQKTSLNERDEEDEGFMNKLTDFFRSLFQSDDEAKIYTERFQNGSIVSVYTQSEEETAQAREILNACGAYQVTERVSEPRTNTINTGSMNIGRTSTSVSTPATGTVDDTVMQYGDRARSGDLNTGTFQKPDADETDKEGTDYSRSL